MHSQSRFVAAALVVGCCLLIGQPPRANALDPLPPIPSPTPLAPSHPVPTPLPTRTPIPTESPPAIPSATPISTPTPPPIPDGPVLDEAIPIVISYGEGVETKAVINGGVMRPLGVPPDQSVTVTIFLSSAVPGTPVTLGLYDGGLVAPVAEPGTRNGGTELLTQVLTVVRAATGEATVQFNFQAGKTLGLYRVLLTVPRKQYLLQFCAVRPRAVPSLPELASPPPLPSPPNPPPAQ